MVKILIVDDEPDVLLVVSERLATRGYQVIKATNGRTALAETIAHAPDLIITDVVMPEVDGYTFLKEVKSNRNTAHIPAIVLTARNKMSDTFALMEGVDFLAKPFEPDALLALIHKKVKPLPLPPTPATTVPIQPSNAPQTQTILLANEQNHTKALAQLLTRKGHNLSYLTNPNKMVAYVKELTPQLIFIEIPLIKFSEVSLIQSLRKISSCQKTPILIYTYASSEDSSQNLKDALQVAKIKDQCLQAGATAYLGICTPVIVPEDIYKFIK